jgi:hypothetical protein
MVVNIKTPIEVNMELLETEDRLFSMRMKVDIKIHHPTGVFIYKANDIWFKCSTWDEFIQILGKLVRDNDESAELSSLSGDFKIKVTVENNSHLFELLCKEQEIGKGNLELIYRCEINTDELYFVKREFDAFPKWW